ncbi:MAG TPA: ABC transporter permease [Lachnospiraceae bacterium]
MSIVLNLFVAAVIAGTPLLFGALGEILTEKSGNINLGVEGMMYMGAVSGLASAYFYGLLAGKYTLGIIAVLLSLIFSFLFGALGGLIYSFLTVTLRADQNVTGLTLTIFGSGFGNFFGDFLGKTAGGSLVVADSIKGMFSNIKLPFLSKIPILGTLFFSYNWMVYFGIVLVIVMAWFFNRSRVGLNLRAVGEDPAAADAVGINVSRYKYLATVIGGGICGIGGMYISMVSQNGVWVYDCVNGYGWLAVALVIFATWSSKRAALVALVFGALKIMRFYVTLPIPSHFYDMMPYIVTIVILVVTSMTQNREHAQPKSCGSNYFREER